jgi:hypothetical protein
MQMEHLDGCKTRRTALFFSSDRKLEDRYDRGFHTANEMLLLERADSDTDFLKPSLFRPE